MPNLSPALFIIAVFTFLWLVTDCNAGTFTTHTITHDNIERGYIKFVPSNLPDAPVPLVFALHGGGGSAANLSRPGSVWREWTVLAERDKFIVVYPDGWGNHWNDCRSDDAFGSTANDVGFIDRLITAISAQHNVSFRQVYSTGFSNGGMMSWRLAFELSHRVAAVAPVAANLPVDSPECPNLPTRPVSVVFMVGDTDSLMPYQGGFVANDPRRGAVRSAQATLDFWRNFLGTGTANVTTALPDTNSNDNSTVTKYEYGSVRSKARLTFYRVFGGGHGTPSIDYPATIPGTGSQNRDAEAIHELWNFMKTKLLQKRRTALLPNNL